MDRIRDRADLIALVGRQAPSPAVRRACVTGKIEVLGGFSQAAPSTGPCWLLRIIGRHGATWIVGVAPNDIRHDYGIFLAPRTPWQSWLGDRMAPGGSLRSGDHPERYADFKRGAA